MEARLEYKYLVSNDKLEHLRKDIIPYLDYDPFAAKMENKEYVVRSIYYDTRKFKCYYEKLEGKEVRNKYRIRGYNYLNDDSKVFLEIKRKNENIISKDRGLIYYNKLGGLFENKNIDLLFSESEKIQHNKDCITKFMFNYYILKLSPVLLIVYNREAFQCKFKSSLRITFDRQLRSSVENSCAGLFNDDNLVCSMPNYFVLEVKFHMVIPDWVPKIIRKYNLQRTSVSKYAICFDKHKRKFQI
ncbi:MAG: polyphosphate polymerase domain-containing protein [bacterium]